MEIKFYIPRWGNRHLSWAAFALKAKQAGYDGIEANLPVDEAEKIEMLAEIKANGLTWIGQHFETSTSVFEDHLREFESWLFYLASASPMFINSQTGKDFFTVEQNSQLIAMAEMVSNQTGVKIIHETHRGKFGFCTSAAAIYLNKFENLRITADFSHWCCVAESYLKDQTELLNLAISRADHIHARVGYPGGPQINHPAAPEWEEAVAIHCNWWDEIVKQHTASGSKELTFTCEFGPFPYMPQLPFSKDDVSDLWEINLYMKNLLKARYSK